MPIQRPKCGKPVVFVRIDADLVSWGTLTLYDDLSCGIKYLRDTDLVAMESSIQPSPDNWKNAVEGFMARGYYELSDAKRSGVLPESWQLPDLSYGCGQVRLSDSIRIG